MRHFYYLLLIIMLLSAASSSAQPTYRLGLRGGINRASSTVAPTSTSPNSQYHYSARKSAIYAWQVGAVLEVTFRHFALQPALVFSQKGEQLDASTAISGFAGVSSKETSSINRYNWLELPVNVVYTLHGFQAFAGPYVALGVGGRQRGTSRSASPFIRYAPYEFDEQIRYGSNSTNARVDVGVNFGVGYRHGPMQVQLGYGLGLRNLHHTSTTTYDSQHSFQHDAAYNRGVQFTATYFFGL